MPGTVDDLPLSRASLVENLTYLRERLTAADDRANANQQALDHLATAARQLITAAAGAYDDGLQAPAALAQAVGNVCQALPRSDRDAAASVPRVARERHLRNAGTGRNSGGPGRVVALPVRRSAWGPYELERQALAEPMPVAVSALHDAGQVRSGDPDRRARDTVLVHLNEAVEAAGLQQGAYERRVLEWLAGGEHGVAQVVIGLVRRAYAAGSAQ
jgi:hypothetical protein